MTKEMQTKVEDYARVHKFLLNQTKLDAIDWFCGQGSECHTLKEEFVKAYNGKIQPAKKEQRDLLFQKMKEEGYEWDKDTKVLNKVTIYE